MDGPYGIAVDSSAHIYVSNSANSTLTVYKAGANGNAAPIDTIKGRKTMMYSPAGIALQWTWPTELTTTNGRHGRFGDRSTMNAKRA